jgi:hypothetical protein
MNDDFSENPVLDFIAYADTIVDIIKNSDPNFTIGIYGEWGTGKTTLMRKIESELRSETSITAIWFNAWRYEREEQFTLIPLLKKIVYSLPDTHEFDGLRKAIKRGIGTIRRNMGQIITSVVSDFVAKSVGLNTAKVVKDISNELIPKIELLTEANEKDTIYFDGLEKIEDEIKKIRIKKQRIRIVVFIDDLDRCSPKKALEVFESVKVFLGVEGFIYVLGLSHETISKLITAEYGKSDIKGDQYIKKIIQIPITLPEWSTNDVSILIDDFIKSGTIFGKYVDIIKENTELIAKAIEKNPRETKRFINNFIVAYEILLRYTKKVNAKELLIVQAINVRWNRFYRLMVKLSIDSRKELKLYVEMTESERNKELETDFTNKKLNLNLKRFLRDFKTDNELWDFLKDHSESIFGIKNWEIYRRGAESVSEIPTVYRVSNLMLEKYQPVVNETEAIMDTIRLYAPRGLELDKIIDIQMKARNLFRIIGQAHSHREENELIENVMRGLNILKDQMLVRSQKLTNIDKQESQQLSILIMEVEELLREWEKLVIN